MTSTFTSEPEPGYALRVRDLHKSYGPVQALRGLDLGVREGEVFGFLGRNGAGKSTALRIAMGITPANSGRIELFGEAVRSGDPLPKRLIGYVAQEQSFYEWMTAVSIGRFVAGFYPTWDGEYYKRLLDLLEVPTQQKLQGFSGGMRAKLALALALAHSPRLLILDEPTAGMDAVARREFLQLVREQAQRTQRSTIFSSHLIDEVELAADRVGIVHDGKMLYQGSVERLRISVCRLTHPLVNGEAPRLAAVDEIVHPGVEVLQDRIDSHQRELFVRSEDPGYFAVLELNGWRMKQPDLEDTFIAMVTRSVRL